MLREASGLPAGKLSDWTVGDVLELQKAVYRGVPRAQVEFHAQAILRFSEVTFPNTSRLHPSLRSPAFSAGILASFCLDYCGKYRDTRFLNAALKLIDYQRRRPWRLGVGPGVNRATARALRCRNRVLAAKAVRQAS